MWSPAGRGQNEELPRLIEAQTLPHKSHRCEHTVTHTGTQTHRHTPKSLIFSSDSCKYIYTITHTNAKATNVHT